MSVENKSIGSLFIRPGKKVNQKWRLMRTYYIDGKRHQESVPRIAYAALGFSDSMTLEQARQRAQQINASNVVQRHDLQKAAGIAKRVERDRLNHSAFMPADLNEQFTAWLTENTSGNEDYVETLKIKWGTAKDIIIGLQLLPEQFASNKKKIFRYLAVQEYSPSYAVKLISLMNQYGTFIARLSGRFYEPIPSPRGQEREMINDAYLAAEDYAGPSEPLTTDLLAKLQKECLKGDFPQEHYAWLFVTLWLGLRPYECDMVMADRDQETWEIEEGPDDVDFLKVYQPKLRSIPKHKRWKKIPIIFEEQREALAYIIKGGATAPLTKTLKTKLGGQYTLRAGRKGFTDLMLEKGQILEHIAGWMGHTNINRTWESYKDKRKVYFTPVLISKRDKS